MRSLSFSTDLGAGRKSEFQATPGEAKSGGPRFWCTEIAGQIWAEGRDTLEAVVVWLPCQPMSVTGGVDANL